LLKTYDWIHKTKAYAPFIWQLLKADFFICIGRFMVRAEELIVRTRFASPYAILQRGPYSIPLCRLTFPA
jgi:hypothetical protein